MSGSKLCFIFIKYKSKNGEDLSFQIEENSHLKIDFSSDSFPKLPPTPTKRMRSIFVFYVNVFFTVVIIGGHCNLLCFHFSTYGEGTLEGAMYNVTT